MDLTNMSQEKVVAHSKKAHTELSSNSVIPLSFKEHFSVFKLIVLVLQPSV